MKFIKKYVKILILFIIVLALIFGGIYILKNKNPYKKEGPKGFYYRTYADGKWSKWCENGKICGIEGKPISNIEFKNGNSVKGNLFYNVYKNHDFVGLNISTEKLLDTETTIQGLILSCSDDLYNDYEIYYRTYNNKYGWLDFSNAKQLINGENGINGAKGYPIEKLQIIILRNNSKTKITEKTKNKSSYGFKIENETYEEETILED